MTATQEAMQRLNNQWYNTLVSGLGLDPSQFQLMQGSTSTGQTDGALWSFFDAIPPESTNHYFNPGQHNSLIQAYGGVINNLMPQQDNAMKKLLKNRFLSWTKYSADPANLPNPLPMTESGNIDIVQVKLRQFQTWGLVNGVPTAMIGAGNAIIEQIDIVSAAMYAWTAAAKKYAYTATQAALRDAIAKGIPKNINMNSATQSADLSQSWADGSTSGDLNFFSAGGTGNWKNFIDNIENQSLDINVSYAKFAVLSGGPYANAEPDNIDLADYKPWWNSSALQTARANNNNKVWNRGAPTWKQTFGAKGNLKRLSTALILVDGIKSTMTSSVSVSESDRAGFEAGVNSGVWPFYTGDGQSGWHSNVTYTEEGSFTVTSESKEGNVQVLGLLVDDIEDVIGGG